MYATVDGRQFGKLNVGVELLTKVLICQIITANFSYKLLYYYTQCSVCITTVMVAL